MSDLREAAKQALEALDGCHDRSGLIQHNGQWVSRRMAAMDALKAALEQSEQEPIDTLAEFETQAGSARQWVSVGAWLYPGERIVHLSTKMKEKNA